MARHEVIREGKKRLRDWLPRARAEARRKDLHGFAKTSLAKAQWPHIREDRIAAVTVYPAPLGGWHADVVLRNMPPGFPNTLGSPVGEPIPTREQAEEMAYRTLVMVLWICEENRKKPKEAPKPVFWLHDAVFDLEPAVYESLLAVDPDAKEGYGSVAHAIERLEDELSSAMPEGFTLERFRALNRERQMLLIAVMHIATLSGLYVYPHRTHGKPDPDSGRYYRPPGGPPPDFPFGPPQDAAPLSAIHMPGPPKKR